jgi:hypothetical protein
VSNVRIIVAGVIYPIETPLADCPQWLLDFIVTNHGKKTAKETFKEKETKDDAFGINGCNDTFVVQDDDDDFASHNGATKDDGQHPT